MGNRRAFDGNVVCQLAARLRIVEKQLAKVSRACAGQQEGERQCEGGGPQAGQKAFQWNVHAPTCVPVPVMEEQRVPVVQTLETGEAPRVQRADEMQDVLLMKERQGPVVQSVQTSGNGTETPRSDTDEGDVDRGEEEDASTVDKQAEILWQRLRQLQEQGAAKFEHVWATISEDTRRRLEGYRKRSEQIPNQPRESVQQQQVEQLVGVRVQQQAVERIADFPDPIMQERTNHGANRGCSHDLSTEAHPVADKVTPQERVQQHIVERTAYCSVSVMRERTNHGANRRCSQDLATEAHPVVDKVPPQERVQQQTVERIAEVPAPIMQERTNHGAHRRCAQGPSTEAHPAEDEVIPQERVHQQSGVPVLVEQERVIHAPAVTPQGVHVTNQRQVPMVQTSQTAPLEESEAESAGLDVQDVFLQSLEGLHLHNAELERTVDKLERGVKYLQRQLGLASQMSTERLGRINENHKEVRELLLRASDNIAGLHDMYGEMCDRAEMCVREGRAQGEMIPELLESLNVIRESNKELAERKT